MPWHFDHHVIMARPTKSGAKPMGMSHPRPHLIFPRPLHSPSTPPHHCLASLEPPTVPDRGICGEYTKGLQYRHPYHMRPTTW